MHNSNESQLFAKTMKQQHQQLKHKARKKKFMEKLDSMNTLSLLSLLTSSAAPLINLILSLLFFFLRRLLTSLSLFLPPPVPPPPPPFTHLPTTTTTTKRHLCRDNTANDEVPQHSSISRALSQTLSMVTEVPVSSRKYDTIRSLAEQLIQNNNNNDSGHSNACQALQDVNRYALSNAFARTLSRLELATSKQVREKRRGDDTCPGGYGRVLDGLGKVGWVVRAVRAIGEGVVDRFGGSGWGVEEVSLLGGGEKFAAELLWLAEKMVACGVVEEAVWRWGEASGLASLAILAEPRLQSIIVKISALLLKHAKEIRRREGELGNRFFEQQLQQARKTMLVSWLPFLCQASNGAEAPALNSLERAEVEKVMEETIEMLGEEEQEHVLALWLHHFIPNPSSDWPNLQACYIRWCNEVRNRFIALQSAT